MSTPTRETIAAAHEVISARVRRTPVVVVEAAAFATPGPVTLKLELVQHTGSFKVRGAFTKALGAQVPAAGLITASGGNAGLAAAYVGRQLGHRVEVFVPATAPSVKVDRLRTLGALVTVGGDDYGAAFEASVLRAEDSGALQIHAYDDPDVVSGQGTVGRELEAQVPDVDTILVAVGGGGLLAGIATWFGPAVAVIGVEPEGAPTLHAALQAGLPVDVAPSGIAADALGARRLGAIAWEVVGRLNIRSLLVPGSEILAARRRLWSELKVAAEPGGAAALAALTCGAYVPEPGERVAVLICGGNSDPSDL